MLLSDPQIYPKNPENQPAIYQVSDKYIHLFSTLGGARYSCRGTKESPHDPHYRLLLIYDERQMSIVEQLNHLEDLANLDDEDEDQDDLTDIQDILFPEADFVMIQCPICKLMYMLSLEACSMNIELL